VVERDEVCFRDGRETNPKFFLFVRVVVVFT
jgi:hypothetical protein